MKAEIKGQKQLMAELEKRFGKRSMTRKVDAALREGAKVFEKALIYEFATTPDKGYAEGATIDEITISDPMWLDGERVIRIHWRGPDNRYRIIHLNEWGTVKNPNPPRKGVIARTIPVSKTVRKVWMASPDIAAGAPMELPVEQQGNTLTVSLPSLHYWDMLVIEY